MRQLAGSGWGAASKILRTAALSLVYVIAEYWALVWCGSTHIRFINSVQYDALRIVTGYLRLIPIDSDGFNRLQTERPHQAPLKYIKKRPSTQKIASFFYGRIRTSMAC